MSDAYPRPETPETDASPAPRRSPLGWVVLGLLFAYMIFGATTRGPSEKPEARIARYTSRLRAAMAAYQAGENPLSRVVTGEESATAALRKLEREVAPKRKDPIEATVWTTVRKQLGERVTKADLAPLQKEPHYALYSEAYRPGKRSRAAASALAAKLEARGEVSKVAADIVRREAGLPVRTETATKGNLIVTAILGLLFLASGAAWLGALVLGGSGVLRALGPAMEARSHAEADVFAVRAATLLATFLGLQLVASVMIAYGLNGHVGQALVYGSMLVAVPIILRSRPSMAEVGLSTKNFGRNVLLGLWAFLLELPVTGAVAILCTVLLRNLPPPEHPASTALSASPDLWTVLVTFLGGAIVAPFWEETMFRGLLFPALRRILRGPIPAALASSFLFASIHPQGPVLWAALASVALFSCFLAQKTRSLVPSVVMHFAHNATLLALTVAMAR